MSHLTTHVLDTSIGHPGKGIAVFLEVFNGSGWTGFAEGETNDDGRVPDFIPEDVILEKGIYRITFETEAYFNAREVKSFYPYVAIVFEIDSGDHYHVPLLLNPYGYSTYRGS